jgi:hypothetical protein
VLGTRAQWCPESGSQAKSSGEWCRCPERQLGEVKSQVVPRSKQLVDSQTRRCRAEQAAGHWASSQARRCQGSRGDARAGKRACTGGAKKPRTMSTDFGRPGSRSCVLRAFFRGTVLLRRGSNFASNLREVNGESKLHRARATALANHPPIFLDGRLGGSHRLYTDYTKESTVSD